MSAELASASASGLMGDFNLASTAGFFGLHAAFMIGVSLADNIFPGLGSLFHGAADLIADGITDTAEYALA